MFAASLFVVSVHVELSVLTVMRCLKLVNYLSKTLRTAITGM